MEFYKISYNTYADDIKLYSCVFPVDQSPLQLTSQKYPNVFQVSVSELCSWMQKTLKRFLVKVRNQSTAWLNVTKDHRACKQTVITNLKVNFNKQVVHV